MVYLDDNGSAFMKLCERLVALTNELIFSSVFKGKAKKNAQDFTRNRKISFEELILFMLLSLKCSTQSGLRRFFTIISKNIVMKQQSLSEARKKVTIWAFVSLFRLTATFMTEQCIIKWHNYRVYAIDGTKVALPSDRALLEYFGGLGKTKSSPTAQASALYDVLNDIVADAVIEPLSTDERTLANKHIDACIDLAPNDKKLLIYDRGYASFRLIERHEKEGLYYLMRVKKGFNKDIDAQTKADGYIGLLQDGKRIRVRVIKFLLDSGDEEVLITNITDRRLGKNAFKKLYFMRWPVECKFDVIKNKLQVENFNTRTVEGVQQDFFAAMYLTNFAAAAAMDVQEEIENARKDKDNKYQYKANMNELIGVLKDRLVLALAADTPDQQVARIKPILDEIKQYIVPLRPERSVPRNPSPRAVKFHHNQKANC